MLQNVFHSGEIEAQNRGGIGPEAGERLGCGRVLWHGFSTHEPAAMNTCDALRIETPGIDPWFCQVERAAGQ